MIASAPPRMLDRIDRTAIDSLFIVPIAMPRILHINRPCTNGPCIVILLGAVYVRLHVHDRRGPRRE
jgi:hypothetical protein